MTMMSWHWQRVGLLFGWLVIGGLGGCSVVENGLSWPLSEDEIFKKAKEFTVIIDGCGAGSGAIIKQEGNTYSVLTAHHVVDKPHLTCLIQTSDEESYQVKGDTITQPVAEVDLGVLTFTSEKSYPVAKLGDSEKVAETTSVYVVGAPGNSEAIGPRIVMFNSGKITGKVRQPKNGYILIYDANTQPGMSGGPVLNDRGEIIGVHGQGDRDEKGMKTGWNLGIPIQIFVNPESYAALKQQQNTTANDYYSQGIAFLNEKDYYAALVSFDQAINLDPNMDKAFQGRGTANYWLNKKQEAVKDYTEAIRINPQNADAYFSRGATLHDDEIKDYGAAWKDYTKAIELNNNYAAAYRNRGLIYYKYEKYDDEAIRDYTKAIELDPNYVYAYVGRGNVYYKQEKYDQAIRDYNKAIELDPNDADAYVGRGLAHDYSQKYYAAIDDYTKAIELDPNDAATYNNRGWTYYNLKEYNSAIRDYNKAIELDPNIARAYNNRGLAHYYSQKYYAAIEDYTKAIELNNNNAWAYYRRGNSYRELKKYEMSIADYTKAINLNSNFTDAYFHRGIAYYYLKEYDLAIADYTKAIEQDRSDGAAYNNRGNVYYDLKKYDEAIRDYTKAIELNNNYALRYYNRGDAYYDSKEYDLAITDFKKAIELDKTDAYSYYKLGLIYDETGDFQTAIENYEKAAELYQKQGNDIWYQKAMKNLEELKGY
jgi:tetratricopeptide (TPR) repeat protein